MKESITRALGTCVRAAFVVCLVLLFGPRSEGTALAARPKKAKVEAPPPDGAYRAHSGKLDLFLPPTFAPVNGRYDVVLHFHGMAKVQESNSTASKLNAAVLSVNLGVASDKYRAATQGSRAFDALLARTHRLVVASGRAKGAKIGRIALSAWSAGFESVSQVLKQEQLKTRIDAVFLADGLHAAYADKRKHVVEEGSLAKYARLTEEAMRGEKLFVLTHSSIPTYGYATVAETVGTMLRLANVEKGPPPGSSPRKMQAIYQVNKGDFHATGFEGTGVSDHIDHIWAMGETMYPLLAARWSKPAAE